MLARRLVRGGRYAEARPLFIDNDQSRLDQYLAQLDAAKKTAASKPEQADALWKAAHLLLRDGASLMDYFDSATTIHRLTGRQIIERQAPSSR